MNADEALTLRTAEARDLDAIGALFLAAWERAYWGDPESEPAIASRHYGPAFYQGYERELSEGPNAAIRHKLYLLYLLLVMKKKF